MNTRTDDDTARRHVLRQRLRSAHVRDARPGSPAVRWGGRLLVLWGGAHTIGALTVEGAGRHAGAWFSRELWGEDFSRMSPANSAYWLSIDSFGPPMALLGLTVLSMNRRGQRPPAFLAWALGAWTVVDAVVLGPTPNGLIIVLAVALLGAGSRRDRAGRAFSAASA